VRSRLRGGIRRSRAQRSAEREPASASEKAKLAPCMNRPSLRNA